MSGEQVVVLRAPGWTPAQNAFKFRGSFPGADYGTHCACCDAETSQRIQFNPSGGYAASAIAIPTCKDCQPHIQKSNPVAAGVLAIVSPLGFALAYRNGIVFAVLGALCLAAAAAIFFTAQKKAAAMRATGHHIGLQVIAIPGVVQVRTTNARFAADVRAKNPALATTAPNPPRAGE